MQKVRNYKCPDCGVRFSTLEFWGKHMESTHPELLIDGFSVERHFYYTLTGKMHGTCIQCKGETEWNAVTGKYERFCKNPKCKDAYREMFKNRMVGKYGKTHLLNDPDQQRKMLMNKKMSGYHTFKDGVKIGYVGTYEKDFLVMLDKFLGLNGAAIMAPSPHTYYYDYVNPNDKENEGRKFYIPDFYVPSVNMEIEIKQNTNTHPKIERIDKVKELCKDKMMEAAPVNYFKIMEKDYTDFFDYLEGLSAITPEVIKMTAANESLYGMTEEHAREYANANKDMERKVIKGYMNIVNNFKKYPEIATVTLFPADGYSAILYTKEGKPMRYIVQQETVSGEALLKQTYINKKYTPDEKLAYIQLLFAANTHCKLNKVSIGRHDEILEEACKEAGMIVYKTNHPKGSKDHTKYYRFPEE